MAVESEPEARPVIGAEIVALQRLTTEMAGDLEADERPMAISWGRRGGKILKLLPWAGLAVFLAAFLLYEFHLIQEELGIGIAIAAILAAVVAQWAVTPRIARYGVLLTDRRLIVMPTTDVRMPRGRAAPASMSRGDVSAAFGHGYFGTTVVLTLTTAAGAAPLRLAFDGPYVPSATAIYLSLASPRTAVSLSLAPPPGPALSDSRTRAVLRQYRYSTWLAILAGIGVLVVVPQVVPEDWLAAGGGGGAAAILLVAVVLIIGGVFYAVRAERWRRVLARYEWREVSYSYSEREERTNSARGSWTSWAPALIARTVAEPGETVLLSLSAAGTRWGWWRLRGWRQAPTGVAWLAGDPARRMVVAQPGPGRLFSAQIIIGGAPPSTEKHRRRYQPHAPDRSPGS